MKKELKLFYDRIVNKEPFSLVRYGDGEYNILNNIPCKRQGFEFDPSNTGDAKFRFQLYDALQVKNRSDYFIGISNKKELKKWYKDQLVNNSVSADVFINSNYLEFVKEFFPLFDDAIVVANKKASMVHLPFCNFNNHLVENNAWRNKKDIESIEEDLKYWLQHKENQIILVAAGPYSCVLIHELWKANPNNFYIDVGSTLDPWSFKCNTRSYHKRIEK